MKVNFTAILLLTFSIGIWGTNPQAVWAVEECAPEGTKKIKIEGYFSQKFRKDEKKIKAEYKTIGNVRTALRPYPLGDTSKNFAIGRCVPAYIARHILQVSQKYTSGIESLVVQEFIPAHWVGVGATMFDELSQQTVTPEQVNQLLNPDLNNEEFHALYKSLTIQDAKVPFFGLKVPNVKRRHQESE
jgi:hypothetical protein